MPERLYQLRFGDDFRVINPAEVTPQNFAGLPFPVRSQEPPLIVSPVGRFVREVKEPVSLTSPLLAADYLIKHIYAPFEQFDQEEVWVLLLNSKNNVTHEVMIYRGTINSVLIRTAEIFKEAVRVNASGLILSHCHPSGSPEPSPEDVAVTMRVGEIANLLETRLEDHIIVGKDSWVSLRERRLGFDGN